MFATILFANVMFATNYCFIVHICRIDVSQYNELYLLNDQSAAAAAFFELNFLLLLCSYMNSEMQVFYR